MAADDRRSEVERLVPMERALPAVPLPCLAGWVPETVTRGFVKWRGFFAVRRKGTHDRHCIRLPAFLHFLLPTVGVSEHGSVDL